jgi:hypothetical protein
MSKLRLFVQNLENRGYNHYSLDGKLLRPEQDSEINEVLNSVLRIKNQGRKIVDVLPVKVTIFESEFLLEVYTDELDNAGRYSPISCSGILPNKDSFEGWREEVVAQIETFAREVNRKFPEKLKNEVCEKLEWVYDKHEYISDVTSWLIQKIPFLDRDSPFKKNQFLYFLLLIVILLAAVFIVIKVMQWHCSNYYELDDFKQQSLICDYLYYKPKYSN